MKSFLPRFIALLLSVLLVCTAGYALAAGSSMTVHNVTYRNIPDGSDGLTITDIAGGGYRTVITIRNDSGNTVGTFSKIAYKAYGANDLVLDTSYFFTDHMNAGETCKVSVWFPRGVRRVDFGAVELDDGDASDTPETIATTVVHNMNFNIPYTREGVTLNVTKVSGSRIWLQMTNGTDIPLSSSSRIAAKCYNKNGEVLDDGYIYLEDLNPGETCVKTVYLASKTKTVVFGEIKLEEGTLSEEVPMQTIGRYEINQVPCQMDSVTITDIAVSSRRIKLTVVNNSEDAVAGYSHFSYKCYNADGEVTDTGSVYLEDMNPGESCVATFYAAKKTTRIVLDQPEIRKGEITERAPMTQYGKLEMNTIPYTSNGLTITDISVKGRKATIIIRNDTGDAISSTGFDYKCYNAAGVVIDTGYLSVEAMNAGESCKQTRSFNSKAVQIVIGEAQPYKGKHLDTTVETKMNGKVRMNIPYSSNGLTISSVSTSNTKIKLVLTNTSDKTIAGYSYIPFRCYDADGYVIDSGTCSTEELEPGESCKSTGYMTKGAKLIIFGEAEVR